MGLSIFVRQEELVALYATVLPCQSQIACWVDLAVYAEEQVDEVLKPRLDLLMQHPLGSTINAQDLVEPAFWWSTCIDDRSHCQKSRINHLPVMLLVPKNMAGQFLPTAKFARTPGFWALILQLQRLDVR